MNLFVRQTSQIIDCFGDFHPKLSNVILSRKYTFFSEVFFRGLWTKQPLNHCLYVSVYVLPSHQCTVENKNNTNYLRRANAISFSSSLPHRNSVNLSVMCMSYCTRRAQILCMTEQDFLGVGINTLVHKHQPYLAVGTSLIADLS